MQSGDTLYRKQSGFKAMRNGIAIVKDAKASGLARLRGGRFPGRRASRTWQGAATCRTLESS